MNFSLFVHMERLDASQIHKSLYEEFVALCEIADKGGMHAIWLGAMVKSMPWCSPV
ncbi:LLM class flavin-dependent oxidoreductase, partial [Rhizobium ruizarguesonis]